MSKKNVIARVGNFEITKEESPYYNYLRIKTIGGDWGVTYRDNNEMYGKIMTMVRDKEYAKTLELTILHIYHTTTILIDEQFAIDYFIALQAMYDRMVAAAPVPPEEENAEAIRETEVLENAKRIFNEEK